METQNKRILKNALSFLQKHEGMPYERALNRLAGIIVTGNTENNPLYQHLVEADLPSDPAELHKILMPRPIHG
jgi:hypothetical protein